MKWKLQNKTVIKSIPALHQVLLKNRSILDVASFFDPPHPHDISLESVGINSSEMNKTVDRLQLAKERAETVVVFGDYDADGVCSTTILWQALHHLGLKALPFIPHREKHGYGMSKLSLSDMIAQHHPDLVITVDNGIVAHEPALLLKSQDIDLIITDHHTPEDTLPEAVAIVHSTQLCGTTVAWMISRTLAPELAVNQLDLCGIGTIADQVQLKDANRSFAAHGITALQKTNRPGLLELLRASDTMPADVSTSTVNYAIAPRLNALGRLDHALDAVRLLCTTNPERAARLVARVSSLNTERQALTAQALATAVDKADGYSADRVIVVASSEYHEGIIGLVAGRLVEKFHKPAVVISIGTQTAKASARSVPGINIIKLIRLAREELLEVGGHPMAAGFSLLPEKIADFQLTLAKITEEHISLEQLKPVIDVEAIIDFSLCTVETVESLSAFEPFGQGNSRPIFGLQKLKVLAVTTMGKENQHLKLLVSDSSVGMSIECIGWGSGDGANNWQTGSEVSLAGTLEINSWKNKHRVQLSIKDLASTSLVKESGE
ncbi:MAG: single-stranded-DNA-specific exonuclease RecJ [bacterium]|nr:single-stranded-DNA-specific exonuclease RecJ [bacterium]